ncbi:amidohydrolase family protein [Daejeonella sp. JGW-45]|uniref:amidohydrolase family protein n=1 Tax=Daejeonella sp. JGW-45 TaxID=3034148 RepID=UPI0023EE1791|nr:amidohydrolase family protein [Daejeonella sp. JGW-45]
MKYKNIILLLLALLSLSYKPAQDGDVMVTVTEGTNMAVALSPDKATIAIALQGTIWTIPAKGGKARTVTDEMGDSQEPAWSPDGQQIVFHSYRDGNYHIWTIRKDGTGLKQLTSGLSDNREPDWSPDGRSVVFSSDRSGNYDIWEIELSGGRLKQLSTDPANDSNPAYSRSGRKVAFVSQREKAGVYVLENAVEKLLISSDLRIAAPSWSPDDKSLAFVAFTGKSMLFDDRNTSYLYVADAGSGKLEQVSKGDEDLFPFRPNWTGTDKIIYSGDGKIKQRSLSVNTTSVIPFEATFSLGRRSYPRKKYDFDNTSSQKALGIAGPVVSPDGSKVAFGALGNIYIQEINGKLIQLTNDPFVDLEPEWSPDGQTLAYISDREGFMSIWLHDLKTNKSRQLSPELKEDTSFPSWSPDGKTIAFYTMHYMKKWGPAILNVADVESGEYRVVNKAVAVPSKADWSPDGTKLALMALKPHSTRFREGFNAFMLVSVKDQSSAIVSPDPDKPLGVRNQGGPAWSPDGKSMAYVKDGTLWMIPVTPDGRINGEEKKLTNELADNLSWTGDSRNIVFIATDRLKKIDVVTGKISDIPVNLNWKSSLPADEYIVHAGKLFNGIDNSYQSNVDIYIKGNRIAGIRPHSSHQRGVRVVDASGKVVMPGLFEMHSHQSSNVGEKLGKIWLSYGITSVREPGADPYDALERKEAWESGVRPGPRLFFTGGLTEGTRVAYGLANSVTEKNHIRMELDRAKRLNYDLIKTYVRMPDSIQKVLTAGAHQLGIPLSSHELYPATKYNVDAIEHLSGTSRRGYSLLLDANFRSYSDVVQLIVRSGINVTPTACLRTGYPRLAKKYDELLDDDRNRKFLTPEFLRGLHTQANQYDSARTPRADENYKALLKTLKQISDAGGRITAGTDAPFAPFGSSLHAEIWVYAEAGISPFKALQSATIRAAEAVGVAKDLGSIEENKLADLIVVDGDPLKRVQDAMKVNQVIKNGKIYTIRDWLKN